MKISDLLDVIEDDTVPIQEKNIVSSERIMELTLAKIHADTDNNGTDRKKLSKGAIAAIVVAACLALSVTAFATGLVSRVVNWQGEMIGEVEEVSVTPPPICEEMERIERTQSILDEANCVELIIVKYTDENGVTGTKSSGLSRTLWSIEELEAALSDKGSELQLFTAPAGYELRSAKVMYDCAEGYEYTLISSETDDSGLTVKKYVLPRVGAVVSGYLIDYRDAEGASLFIMGRLLSSDVEFTIDEDETVRSIPVDGMDSALLVEQTDGTGPVTLEMAKALAVPIPYVEKAILSGAFPTEDDIFKKAWYSVNTDSMDADALLEWISEARPVVS